MVKGDYEMKMSLSLPALERLIGGDSEIEVELRHQILENFTKARIKTLINDSTLNAVYQMWRKDIERLVYEALNDKIKDVTVVENPASHSSAWTTLQSKITNQIDAEITKRINQAIEYQKNYWGGMIKRAVEQALAMEIKKEVEAEVQRRLKAAMEMK
jgi:predicted Fe-Mo cluster-binding NifX family protein